MINKDVLMKSQFLLLSIPLLIICLYLSWHYYFITDGLFSVFGYIISLITLCFTINLIVEFFSNKLEKAKVKE